MLFTVINKRIKIIKNLVYLVLQKMEERIGMEWKICKKGNIKRNSITNQYKKFLMMLQIKKSKNIIQI